MLARSSTSASTAIALPPAFSMRALAFFKRSARRATSATAAPFAASTCAKRSPSPLEAPVTSATRPVKSKSDAAFIASCPVTHPPYNARGSAVARAGTYHSTTSAKSWIPTNGITPT